MNTNWQQNIEKILMGGRGIYKVRRGFAEPRAANGDQASRERIQEESLETKSLQLADKLFYLLSVSLPASQLDLLLYNLNSCTIIYSFRETICLYFVKAFKAFWFANRSIYLKVLIDIQSN